MSTGDKPGVAHTFAARQLEGGHHAETAATYFIELAILIGSFGVASAQKYSRETSRCLRTLYLAPVFIGIDRGLFKARDLEVEYKEIDSGALSSAALLSGSAQVTSDDLMGIAPLAKQGKHFMMVWICSIA